MGVKITMKEVVVPLMDDPVQHHRMPLSNLDLIFPHIYVSVFFCYKTKKQHHTTTSGGTRMEFRSKVSVLKNSLAKTLVSYYPFAGVMDNNADGEIEVLCNNRGVDFTEAFADVELNKLDLYKPDESFRGKLLPNVEHGLLAVQATELKCGGAVVGCTFDHRFADAYSANLFFVSWSEMARLGSMSYEPSFCRSFLNPQSPPPPINPSINEFYAPAHRYNEHRSNQPYISRLYSVSADNIKQLQLSTNSQNTKFEAFSAFLWKIAAKGTNSCSNRLAITIDGRSLLFNDPSLMTTYFGNVITTPFVRAKTDQLQDMPMNWVANEVHKLIKQTRTKEHFLGLIDYVESIRPEPTLIRIGVDKTTTEEPAFIVSSGQRFPITKIDFGWGNPAFGSYYLPFGQQGIQCGYVMPMGSATGNGDWVVYMHLYKQQIDAVETYASHIFKPVENAYI